MALLESLGYFGLALWDFVVAIGASFLAIATFIWSIPSRLPSLFILLAIASAAIVPYQYGDVIVENAAGFLACSWAPFYDAWVRPILEDIIQVSYEYTICWWDLTMLMPYNIVRQVFFPALRDCGFSTTMMRLADWLVALTRDWLIGYVASGLWFTSELDYSGISTAWIALWDSWLDIVCCGCLDMCAVFVDLPVIPMAVTSRQLSDPAWSDFIGKTFNGFMVVIQTLINMALRNLYPFQAGRRRRRHHAGRLSTADVAAGSPQWLETLPVVLAWSDSAWRFRPTR